VQRSRVELASCGRSFVVRIGVHPSCVEQHLQVGSRQRGRPSEEHCFVALEDVGDVRRPGVDQEPQGSFSELAVTERCVTSGM
jgi:hypothetical protein